VRKSIAVLLTIAVIALPFGMPYLLWQKKVNEISKWPIISARLDSGGETTTDYREYDPIDANYKTGSSTTSGISYTYWVNGTEYHNSQSWSGHYGGPHSGWGVYVVDIRYNPKNPSESIYDPTKVATPVWIYFVSILLVPNVILYIWSGWAKRKSIRSLYFPKSGKSE
jgi:hypothetical protein